MTQSNMDVDGDQAASVVLTDLNQALQALASLSSGTTAPTTTYPYQFWFDTTAGVLKQRNAANNAWVVRYLAESLSTSIPSGTSVDQAIPADVSEIKITTLGLSLSGTDDILVQIGTGSTPLTTNYLSVCSTLTTGVTTTNSTTGFNVEMGNASKSATGILTLSRLIADGTEWSATWNFRLTGVEMAVGAGAVTLSGPLDIVRVRASGTNTFDAGRLTFNWS